MPRSKISLSSSAVHDLQYVGELKHWVIFQHEIRQEFNSIAWHDYPSSLEVELRSTRKTPGALHEEYFVAGNALSTNSRFSQHVLHVMSGVAKTTGLRVRFGDWDAPRTRNATKEMTKALNVGSSKSKTSDKSKDRGLQPDFLILGPASENPAAGKGKPPFRQHPFEQHVKEAMDGSNYIWEMFGK